MSLLRLSPDLSLPEKFATEGVVAVGMRGSGKSNTLVRWAEVLYDARIPFVAIDPKGDWYGIKSSADGKKPGLSVPVFGGLYYDFPLGEHSGVDIANLLVDKNLSAVLDVSVLSATRRNTFITDFCRQIMARHQKEPHVRCVIFEEAHRYIPQQVTAKTAALKEAAASILLEGRSFGLGCWAATQRPARLHKDVLEEVGTVVLHRIGAAASNDLRTIGGWVKHEDLGDEIMQSITRLGGGEAWVLSPVEFDIVKRVQIDRRQTYDSGATPTSGLGTRPSLTMADIDASEISAALAASIERAKENDPKELKVTLARARQETAALEAKVATLEARIAEMDANPLTVVHREPYLPPGIEPLANELASMGDDLARLSKRLIESGVELGKQVSDVDLSPRVESGDRAAVGLFQIKAPAQPLPTVPRSTPSHQREGDRSLGKAHRKILAALAQYHPAPRSVQQVAILAGYVKSGGGFRNAVSALRTSVLIVGTDPLAITDEGLDALGSYEPLPRGPALVDYWLRQPQLGKAHRAILAALVESHPGGMDRAALAKATDYEESGGGFRNAISKLRTMELIHGRDTLFATDDFFN